MGFDGIYPLVISYIAIEHGPVEIVSCPMCLSHGDFPVRYVTVYQRVFILYQD